MQTIKIEDLDFEAAKREFALSCIEEMIYEHIDAVRKAEKSRDLIEIINKRDRLKALFIARRAIKKI